MHFPIFRASFCAALWLAACSNSWSQATLSQAFESAWLRQPEAQGLAARRESVRAQQQAARAWTPEPVALELSGKSDRLGRNTGSREHELGLAVPLWLPGERRRSQALADAEGQAVESQLAAARLRVAGAVREAWWTWQRAVAEAAGARAQLDSLQRIAADVGRRLKAGDLARADQHQADGAVAAAEAVLAQADAARLAAQLQLRALTAADLPLDGADGVPGSDAEPAPTPAAAGLTAHAELQSLQDRATVAGQALALAATQSRANPELTLATTRERGAFGEAAQQTVTLGLRIPLGSAARHDVRRASAQAQALELQAQLALERSRVQAGEEAARLGYEAAGRQRLAAERRARLAQESRGFFDKSFRLGETDLPTRLRIEAEAAEAERQAGRARIEQAAAISAWRQALGLLPP